MTTYTITSTSDLPKFATTVLGMLPSTNTARVIALKGDLGAGKTTFVQAVASELGVHEVVTSPTFVVMKQYEVEDHTSGYEHLIHIDAYRIEQNEEMTVLGFAELLQQPNTLICIEWAERIGELVPADALALEFTTTEKEGERIITIHGN
jgi:tRNA threonylcarbamoyladenosine biosynthesis protein TsaE